MSRIVLLYLAMVNWYKSLDLHLYMQIYMKVNKLAATDINTRLVGVIQV